MRDRSDAQAVPLPRQAHDAPHASQARRGPLHRGREGWLDAWDVDRLIRLAADLPVGEVALDSIWELDTAYWSLPDSGPTTVREVVTHMRLVQDVDPSYPVILGSDGRVMDGMHRIARAALEGRTTIRAVRFPVHPEPDFRDCRPEDLPYDPA